MKIVITGTKGIAQALKTVLADHDVCLLSRSTGHDIREIHAWGHHYVDHDVFINCAYDDWAQVSVLDFFYQHWKLDVTKTIVTIGSRVVCHSGISQNNAYWPYRSHKQALQSAHDVMQADARCRMLIINPGPTDTDMVRHHNVPKLSPDRVAQHIRDALFDPVIRRLDLWL